MSVYLRSIDYDLWGVVANGFTRPSSDSSEWTHEEKRLAQLDMKGLFILHCALSQDQFEKISTCESSHEAWRTLQITHEGTTQVKKTKINLLMQQYEMFRMTEEENIGNVFYRFLNIVNSLKGLGRVIL
jgi:hypothetical protein